MKPRQFEPTNVRISENRFKKQFWVRCSCGHSDCIESFKSLPDDVVRKKLSQKGWSVTGKNRDKDVCPKCLGVGTANRLASERSSREAPLFPPRLTS